MYYGPNLWVDQVLHSLIFYFLNKKLLENDWSHLANKKLDSYERSLQNLPTDIWESADGTISRRTLDTFGKAFEFSFLLITTIGLLS